MFLCEKCGMCCRMVGEVYGMYEMALPNGICKYLNCETNLCKIYNSRPIFCRVEEYYNKYLKGQMSKEYFYTINKEECRKLQKLV